MAGLTGRERGQLLLLGAIVIGFVIVTLSLTLNGGLYAETMADEAVEDVSHEETRYLLADVRSDGAWLLSRATTAHPASPSTQETYVADNVTVLDEQYRRYYARSDAAVGVTYDGRVLGRQVSQASGDYTYDADGDGAAEADWTVIPSGQVRNASLTVTGGTGAETRLVFDDGDEYAIAVADTGRVTVQTPSGTADCATSATLPMRVDVSAATVNGDRCDALAVGTELDSTYELRVENGDAVTGSYSLTTDGPADGPSVRDRLYAVDLIVTHRTTTVDYEGTIRVAPGEL